MSPNAPPDRTVKSLRELYLAHGCADAGAFDLEMEERWSEPDWAWAELLTRKAAEFEGDQDNDLSGQDLMIRVSLHASDGVFDSDELTDRWLRFPFTVGDFWGLFHELDAAVDSYRRAASLPLLASRSQYWDLIDEFADFFAAEPTQLIDALGGGWRTVRGPGAGWTDENVQRWYAAGDPIQVLMGIGGRIVVFGVPDPFHSAGDEVAGIDRNYRGVSLRDDDLLVALGEACRHTQHERTRGWSVCHGCRRFADNTQPSGEKPYCSACREYFEEGSDV